MMRPAPLAAVLILAILPFAGCVGDGSDGAGGPRVKKQRGASAGLETDPTKPHVHDDWNTAERLTLVRDSVTGGGSGSAGGRVGWGVGVLPNQTVLVGTERFEVFLKGNITGTNEVGLRYSPPESKSAMDAALLLNEWTPINIVPEWVDRPHTRQSQWGFSLRATLSGESVRVDVEIQIDIIRGKGGLPTWPAHPDGWKGNQSKQLYEASGPVFDHPGASSFGRARFPPPPVLSAVPWNTSKLVVSLHYNSSTPPAFHWSPVLSYRGADKASGFEARYQRPTSANQASVNGLFRWEVPVHERMWDSPYVTQSQWLLRLDWSAPSAAPGTFLYPRLMDGTFHLVVEAQRGA